MVYLASLLGKVEREAHDAARHDGLLIGDGSVSGGVSGDVLVVVCHKGHAERAGLA